MLEALGDFADALLEIAEQAMASPWIYAVIFLLATVDSFFPVVPAETLVITAGVFAASGPPALLLVILAASFGAYVGDHLAYGIGHLLGRRLYLRAAPDSKTRNGFVWAERQLQERGGLILVICRQIPGGRTAVTLTAGTVHYPLRKFSFFEIFAALSWGAYAGLIGYFGGMTFGNEPLKGLAVGFGIAIAVTIIVEGIRYWINRRRRDDAEPVPVADSDLPDAPVAPRVETTHIDALEVEAVDVGAVETDSESHAAARPTDGGPDSVPASRADGRL